ncbi:MAG: T9SS type A sorting domain-containing protein, partial [Calditrichaeota bacterium]|nr:T9SS type A sorting domain-containing protein [Calditrichota bacterium]
QPNQLTVENFNLNAYPNPFNGEISISFNAGSQPVSLYIYNAHGQRVNVLLDRQKLAPAKYTVKWRALNLASGIYFVVLQNGIFKDRRKIVLIK